MNNNDENTENNEISVITPPPYLSKSDNDCPEVSYHSMLDQDENDENIDNEGEIETKDVERQDNEDEYKQQRKQYEIILIVMCCLFMFSTSFSKATPKDMQVNLPNAQQTLLQKHRRPIYESMSYGELASKFVSWIAWIEAPIILIAPFAGYLVNRYNAKIALITFMILSYLGSSFCSLSVYYHIASWFPLGRFIFGLGVGCLRIAVNVVIKESVEPEQLAFYMQYPRTSEKSASILDGYFTSSSFLTMRYGTDSKWVSFPFIVGTGLIMISLPFFILFFYEPQNKNEMIEMVTIKTDDIIKDKQKNENDNDEDKVILNPFVFVWTKMKTFPRSYWLIILILFFNDAASGVYQGVLPQFLNIYYIPRKPDSFWKQSANIRQIPAYFAMLSPIFGFIVDWSASKRYLLLLFGCIGLVIHHLINIAFAITRLNEQENENKWINFQWIVYINLLFQGFINAFIGSVLVPGIAFVTKRSALSVAFGIQSSIGAIAALSLTKIISYLVQLDKIQIKNNYPNGIPKHKPNPVTKYTLIMSIIFTICSICCLLLTLIFIWFYRENVCPKQIIPQVRDDGVKIVQEMEEKDEVTTIRSTKFKKKTPKKRLKISPEKQQQMRRRSTSIHYLTRFG